jgi:hypothetical protein
MLTQFQNSFIPLTKFVDMIYVNYDAESEELTWISRPCSLEFLRVSQHGSPRRQILYHHLPMSS